MKVGITGGNGFIGRAVVAELRRHGDEPIVFDTRGRGDEFAMDIQSICGDVRDDVAMTELAAHVDGIIHLAAVLGTQETITNPRPAVLSNITGGLNFLEAITQYQIPGVNICVGNHWMENSYSISKTAVERLGRMFVTERATLLNQVRVVNAYGPGQSAAPPFGAAKVRKIMPAFICRALAGMPIEVYGDGSQISDCVFIDDVARALVSALHRAAGHVVFDGTVEVGPYFHSTVLDVATIVADEVSRLQGTKPAEIVHLPMRPGEQTGRPVVADTSTLAWVCMSAAELVPLRDGIGRTVEYFMSTEGRSWSRAA